MTNDRVRALTGPELIAAQMERYREELRNFTDSLPGIIAGNNIPTERADLVKWQGGFKKAAHHLRLAAAEIELLRTERERILRAAENVYGYAARRDLEGELEGEQHGS